MPSPGSDEREVSALKPAVLELLEELANAASAGVSMGELVDRLEARGHRERDVEQAIWQLLQERRLTPNGFVCRTIRAKAPGRARRIRSYEFTLIPWSVEQDAQLDFPAMAGE